MDRYTGKWWSKQEIGSWPLGFKKCRGCLELLSNVKFHRAVQGLFGLSNDCKECRKPYSKGGWGRTPMCKRLYCSAKSRAKKRGLEFTLVLSDIVIPENCPVFEVPLCYKSRYAPSLDRLNPNIGYTPSNITVMSKRANTLKNNATLEELEMVISWMKRKGACEI